MTFWCVKLQRRNIKKPGSRRKQDRALWFAIASSDHQCLILDVPERIHRFAQAIQNITG
ncbi:hypothetical protein D3C87_1939380 [compost metagenome]